MEVKQYDLQYAIQRHLSEELTIPVDIVYDGYKLRDTKPFVTLEQMQNNNEIIAKMREASQVIYRFQVGLRASNSFEKVKLQEQISDIFTFNEIPYFDTEDTVDNEVGFFCVDLTGVVPMFSDEKSRETDYHRVYFDIEIDTKKYKGRR